jgi:hypothetical protein
MVAEGNEHCTLHKNELKCALSTAVLKRPSTTSYSCTISTTLLESDRDIAFHVKASMSFPTKSLKQRQRNDKAKAKAQDRVSPSLKDPKGRTPMTPQRFKQCRTLAEGETMQGAKGAETCPTAMTVHKHHFGLLRPQLCERALPDRAPQHEAQSRAVELLLQLAAQLLPASAP